MKPFCITLLTLAIIILTLVGIGYPKSSVNEEYLRIHIRANSNEEVDQSVKYLVKEKLVNYLTPILSYCKTKEKAEIELTNRLTEIEKIADSVLLSNGYDYKSKAKINTELFPTRTYENLTLDSGYYDALILELGEGKGDNWWCVVYPPLCFVDSGAGYIYKSKILEIIKEFFKT
jgi:stage II sporulation protein R